MNLARVSQNGQITVPIEIRRQLGLKTGDKILFLQNGNGEIVLSNASSNALLKAQNSFSGLLVSKARMMFRPLWIRFAMQARVKNESTHRYKCAVLSSFVSIVYASQSLEKSIG